MYRKIKNFIPTYVKSEIKVYLKKIKFRIPKFVINFINLNTSTKKFNGFKFKFYTQDLLSVNSIGKSLDWEPHIMKFSEIYLSDKKSSNIVDAGAHIGYHTLNFAKLTTGTVYSFEPQPQNYKLLMYNFKINEITNISPFMIGLSDVKKYYKIPIISKSLKLGNMGDFTLNNLTSNLYIKILSDTLDSFKFKDISLIKIDVQGWEKKVLTGAKETIEKYKPVIIIELEKHQLVKTNTTVENLLETIRQLNYSIFYLEHSYPSDHICVHESELNNFSEKFNKHIFKHEKNNAINENFKLGINKKIVM